MSRRPACTPVGKDASKGRLGAVLAAGLAHHGRPRPAPTEAFKLARKAVKRTNEEIPPNILTAVPFELLQIILSYSKGMPCEKITELRLIDNSFDQLLQGEDFWQWQCKLRDYDREDRLFRDDKVPHYWTLPLPAPGTVRVPYRGSWRRHYKYWCRRQLNTMTLRGALKEVIVFGATVLVPPHIHPYLGPIASWDVSQVTDMSYLFYRANRFTGDLSKWDVSNVTNMQSMFSGANSFKGGISAWDVSSVTNMGGMFATAVSFTGDLSTWNVSNVTIMEGMFSGTRLSIGGLSGWDVSSVEIMDRMFADTSNFNDDLSKWDVSSVTDMYGMFQSAVSFNGNISNWDVSSVTVMSWMFEDATSFNGDLSRWDVRKVEVMEVMFEGATSYKPGDGYGLGERAGWRDGGG